jgi:hypothetical protein
MRSTAGFLLIVLIILTSCGKPHEVLIEAESFNDKGGWIVDPQFVEQMGSPYLLAHGMGVPVKNAIIYILSTMRETWLNSMMRL